jgi:hypothetical protein
MRHGMLNVPDEVADNFDPVCIVRKLDVVEVVLDQDQQFQTVEPVGAEIVAQVRIVRDAADVDVEMVCEKCPNVVRVRAVAGR